MKAKLGYLCSSVSWGGLEMNHLRNAAWMRDRGHEVVVICVADSPIAQQAETMNLPILFIEGHKKYYDFAKAKKLAALLRQHTITHLLIRSTYDMSICANVKRKLGDQLHTSYFMEMQLGVTKKGLSHSLRYKFIDLWSCPLPWLQKQVQDMTHFKNTLALIPSGLDLSQFASPPTQAESRKTLDLPASTFLFGLIGRFDEQKGQLLLLEAMARCSHNDFGIVLLGEPTLNEGNAYFEHMQATIREHALEERVFLRPFRKDTTVFYSAIDWLVMATKAETFGMVTVEAMASGTPVLGSNAGGTPELLEQEKGGQLFETLNSDDLAAKMDEILTSKRSIPAEQLREMTQKFDHHSVCAQVERELHLG